LPVFFRKRAVAGRKILIPIKYNYKKNINIFIRFLLKSLKDRPEKNLYEKLFNELLDVFLNRGLCVKKRLQYCKDIKINMSFLRFLKN